MNGRPHDHWRVIMAEGVNVFVHLCPPGDLDRLRMHYPDVREGAPMKREDWMKAIDDETGRP